MGVDSSNGRSVFSFQDMPTEKLVTAGGKGAVLCSLYRGGYPVPPGFVILPEAFDGDHISNKAWDQVRDRIEEYASPGRGLLLAVRSSATGEDSRQASFAGGAED